MIRAAALALLVCAAAAFAAGLAAAPDPYREAFDQSLARLNLRQREVLTTLSGADLARDTGRAQVREAIARARAEMKRADLWLRYLEPVLQRRINGPLAVEWETEVFEKFEPPYRREGAGLLLAEQMLEEDGGSRDSIAALIRAAITAVDGFHADSITRVLSKPDHFLFANRLFLLNLAAIYTTGFECPAPHRVIPELGPLLAGTRDIYEAYGQSFPGARLPADYLDAYDAMALFVASQPRDFAAFDHFEFIRDHVDRLFALNQRLIRERGPVTRSYNDYTLDHNAASIFDPSLYSAQNTLGVYSLIDDPAMLAEIRAVGRLLFHDPVVSGNLKRSCASCHKPDQAFTDTLAATALEFDPARRLPRNTPSLLGVTGNHLLMLDGKHLTLDEQARAVIVNPAELAGDLDTVLRRVMSCRDYRSAFRRFLKRIPEERTVTIDHVVSAITAYVGQFSGFVSPFDDAITGRTPATPPVQRGFNLFMSKAQCGTCHFVPAFNGVKPPYIGSEFEVLGTPADSTNRRLADDRGRAQVHGVPEMLRAFRTGTLRNITRTAPYMHHGGYRTLDQVIDFYDSGGGAGLGLDVPNQTLAADSLRLTPGEKADLVAFLESLDERLPAQTPPTSLPRSSLAGMNRRRVGGEY